MGRGCLPLVETKLASSLARLGFCLHLSEPSRVHLPASLGSMGVTPLLGYYGCSDSHRAAFRALWALNSVLVPMGLPVYLVHTSNPSVPNHPIVPTTAFVLVHSLFLLVVASQGTLSARQTEGIAPTWVMARASLSARRLAGRCGRIGFTLCHGFHVTSLRTGCSPPAASHPVLPRRSCLRLQAGELTA